MEPTPRKKKKKMPASRVKSLQNLEQKRKQQVSSGEIVRLPTTYITPEEGQMLDALKLLYGSKSAAIKAAITALYQKEGL